eukprot:scaffold22298_cov55-Phaeocystis_antarctica.AAC.1
MLQRTPGRTSLGISLGSPPGSPSGLGVGPCGGIPTLNFSQEPLAASLSRSPVARCAAASRGESAFRSPSSSVGPAGSSRRKVFASLSRLAGEWGVRCVTQAWAPCHAGSLAHSTPWKKGDAVVDGWRSSGVVAMRPRLNRCGPSVLSRRLCAKPHALAALAKADGPRATSLRPTSAGACVRITAPISASRSGSAAVLMFQCMARSPPDRSSTTRAVRRLCLCRGGDAASKTEAAYSRRRTRQSRQGSRRSNTRCAIDRLGSRTTFRAADGAKRRAKIRSPSTCHGPPRAAYVGRAREKSCVVRGGAKASGLLTDR